MKLKNKDTVTVCSVTKPFDYNLSPLKKYIVKGRYTDLIDGLDYLVLTDTQTTFYVKAKDTGTAYIINYGEYKNGKCMLDIL